jgi:hypothetical protein
MMRFPENDGPETPAYQDSYAADFEPLRGMFYFRVVDPGKILEVDSVVISTEEWKSRPESSDPTWRSLDHGLLTLAVKVLC